MAANAFYGLILRAIVTLSAASRAQEVYAGDEIMGDTGILGDARRRSWQLVVVRTNDAS